MLPVAAVGGIADSGLVFRLTRGRLWIGLLGALLVGIVGLNVAALSLSASSSAAAHQADELKRQNSGLEAQLASMLSADELEKVATDLDLHNPLPGAIGYVKSSPDDAAVAAKRLRDGELSVAPAAPVTEAIPADPALATDPELVTDPAATDPALVDPAAAAPVSDPASAAPPVTETAVETPATTLPAAAGGVPSP